MGAGLEATIVPQLAEQLQRVSFSEFCRKLWHKLQLLKLILESLGSSWSSIEEIEAELRNE